jgi:hydrogenase expression/formation protein HypC
MCLAVPAKVLAIDGSLARVAVEGNVREVGIRLVPGVKVGDFVLVHAGFAVEIVDEEAAQETLELFRQLLGGEIA